MKGRGRLNSNAIRFSLILFSIIIVCRDFSGQNTIEERSPPSSERRVYIVPFLRGQGLNNQIWEYRTAAIIARATRRSLCMVPFHRFYLERKGRPFLPFQEIFDSDSLKEYVTSVSKIEDCAAACSGTLQRVVELVSKPTFMIAGKKPYPIVDARPGSLDKFKRSTTFERVPNPTFVNINEKNEGTYFDSMLNISRALSKYSADNCIAVAGVAPEVFGEFTLWNKHLIVSPNIRRITSEIKNHVFSNESYLSIHWRFEESKCAGFGIGIGNGRDLNAKPKKIEGKFITRTRASANICFFGGIAPKKPGTLWIRLVHRDDIVSWIKETMKKYNLKKIYLATDCKDTELLRWIKFKTAAKTVSDLQKFIGKSTFLEDNDIVSRIEQEVCADAYIFAGTQKSSWSTRVVEERTARIEKIGSLHNSFHDQTNIERVSVYFDEEICKIKVRNKSQR